MSHLIQSSQNISRRNLLRAGLAGTAVGLVGAVLAPASLVGAQVEGAT